MLISYDRILPCCIQIFLPHRALSFFFLNDFRFEGSKILWYRPQSSFIDIGYNNVSLIFMVLWAAKNNTCFHIAKADRDSQVIRNCCIQIIWSGMNSIVVEVSPKQKESSHEKIAICTVWCHARNCQPKKW